MAAQIRKSFSLGEFRLEPDLRLLARDGREVHLANKPFQVLLYLVEHRDRLVSRDELLDKFWDGCDVYDDTLRKAVGAIRKALDDPTDSPRFIETRRAGGYRYIGPLAEEILSNSAALEIEQTRGVRVVVEEEIHDSAPPALAQPQARRWLPALAALAIVLTAAMAFVYRHRAASSPAPVPPRSLAVLPLKNLSGDAADEYLSDGIAESLINELAKINDLKVVSRASAFTFKGRETDPREVGRQLGVAYLLEGSVNKSGERLRVNLRLVSAADGRVVWAGDSYDRAWQDIFTVQDEISCNVAENLRVLLCDGYAHKRYTQNPAAYDAYLKGRYHWNKRTAEGLQQALAYFGQAVKLDPNYALAYCGLASSYKLAVWYVPLPASEAVPKMRAAAQKAVALDPQLAEARLAMVEVYSFDWKFDIMLRELEQARRLAPNNADLQHAYGVGVALLGRFDEGLAASRRALELDPLSLVINTDLGWVYYLARRYDEAVAQYRKTLALDPNFTLARFDLALALSQQGKHDEAVAEMLRARGRGSDYLAGLGYVYAAAGRRQEALKTLAELKQMAQKQYVPPYHLAYVHTGLGDTEQALAALEKTYAEHTQHVVDFKTLPLFDPLRPNARFQNLLRRVGLPD
jgi:TolB-like protein/DNA-binding winged helix-turn-helix (wHTH) protein/Tfp pilus assembly protein PilF